MPKGPKGEKRPADVIGAAVMVAKIATGEEPEDYGSKPEKNQAVAELARKGGRARAQGLSAKRRIEIAKRAAQKKVAKGLIELRLPVENVSAWAPPASAVLARRAAIAAAFRIWGASLDFEYDIELPPFLPW
jgi:hypothetical protein